MENQKKEILRMVESGLITTDEALKLLEAMNDAETLEEKQDEMMNQSLSTHVKFDEEDEKVYQEKSTVGKLSGFLQNALNKLSKMDFNFASSVDFSHIFSFPVTKIKGMNFDLFNGSVMIRTHEKQEVRVECNVRVYKQKHLDEGRDLFFKEVYAHIVDDVLRIDSDNKFIKVDTVVYVPDESYERAQIRLFNGPIHVEAMSFDTLLGKTANGNVTLHQITAKKCEIETANGKIAMTDSAGEVCELETVNGKIEASEAFEKFEAGSITSAIEVKVTKPLESKVELKSATGNITCLVPRGVKVKGELETNFGGFTCDLEQFELIHERKEKLEKELKFAANTSHITTITLEAESKAGSIFVKHLD